MLLDFNDSEPPNPCNKSGGPQRRTYYRKLLWKVQNERGSNCYTRKISFKGAGSGTFLGVTGSGDLMHVCSANGTFTDQWTGTLSF